jgi:putative oxidoreductase
MARTFFMSRFEESTLGVLRVMAALMLMQHGVQKLFGWLVPPDRPARTLELLSQRGLAGVLEVFGGMLLAFGLFTRPVAFVLSGLTACAYFLSHAPDGFWPILNRGELAAVYCFLFFYLSARGGGFWSLDGVLERRRRAARIDFTREPGRR